MAFDALNFSAGGLAMAGSWVATGIGLGLWIWSWVGEKNLIQKLRLRDCGVVLLFSGILARIVVQDRPMMAVDWAMVFLGPLFIAAALWRLTRTANGGGAGER
jgi:type IV secretory pathway VirB6-like protein